MPLQIRRGSTAQRLAITPLIGELVYDTTTGQLFVGNGTTVGGATTTGISTEDAQDAAASLFTTGSHSGITFAYNDAAGRIDATVTVAATGPFDGDLTGSVFSDGSTLLVDGVNGELVGSLRTSGDVYITKNSYSGTFGNGLTFAQHHATADAVNFNFLRTRGTDTAIQAVQNGDDIVDLNFIGHDGTNRVSIGGITARVAGAVSTGIVPGELAFDTRNAAGVLAEKAVLTSEGIWKVNTIQALSGTLTVTGNLVGNVDGDLQGSVFADNSTRIIDGTSGGSITAANASLSRSFTLPVYTDNTDRDTTITAPSAGMMIFNTALIKFQGYTGSAWVDLN